MIKFTKMNNTWNYKAWELQSWREQLKCKKENMYIERGSEGKKLKTIIKKKGTLGVM